MPRRCVTSVWCVAVRCHFTVVSSITLLLLPDARVTIDTLVSIKLELFVLGCIFLLQAGMFVELSCTCT